MLRYELYEAVARNAGDFIEKGTVASLTGTTIDALSLIHPLSGQLKGYQLFFYSGAGAGQYPIVTDFLPANNRVQVDQAFNPAPSTNTAWMMFRRFRKLDYDNAFNRAFNLARLKNLQEYVATLAIVATQYEYTVPSGMSYINTFRIVPTAGSDYAMNDEIDRIFEIEARYIRIERNVGGSYAMSFDSRMINLSSLDGAIIKVMGQAPLNIAGTDNADIPESVQEYLISATTQFLVSAKVGEDENFKTLFSLYQGNTRELEKYIFVHRRGKKVG